MGSPINLVKPLPAILTKYADWDGMTDADCQSLVSNGDVSTDQCTILQSVLHSKFVDSEVNARFRNSGLHDVAIRWILDGKAQKLRLESLNRVKKDASVGQLPQIAVAFRDPSDQVRDVAKEAFVALGKPAIPLLADALKDQRYEIRKTAAEALGAIKDRSAVPFLVERLKHKEYEEKMEDVWKAAASALGTIGDPAAAAPLLEAEMFSQHSAVQSMASSALHNLGPQALHHILPLLIDLSDEKHTEEVRLKAIYYLGKAGGQDATDRLTQIWQASEGKSIKVRNEVAWALGDSGSADAIPVLRASLKEGNSDAVWRLCAIKDVKALPVIMETLRDYYFGEEKKISGDDLEKMADILSRQGKAAVPALIASLQDAKWPVRRLAAMTLGSIKDPAAVPALINAIQVDGEYRGVLHSAAEALGNLGDPRAIPALMSVLIGTGWANENDGKRYVRGEVASAIGKMGKRAREVVPELITIFLDDEFRTRGRVEIAEALGDIGDRRAIPALEGCSRNFLCVQREFDSNVEEALAKLKGSK